GAGLSQSGAVSATGGRECAGAPRPSGSHHAPAQGARVTQAVARHAGPSPTRAANALAVKSRADRHRRVYLAGSGKSAAPRARAEPPGRGTSAALRGPGAAVWVLYGAGGDPAGAGVSRGRPALGPDHPRPDLSGVGPPSAGRCLVPPGRVCPGPRALGSRDCALRCPATALL